MDNDKLFSQADKQHELGRLDVAFKLFLEAAEQGDSSAMSRLACMYADGEGVLRDFEKSIEWDKKAIDAGNTTSLLNLAITYRTLGDIISSKYWFEKALDKGDSEAALQLAKLYMISDKEREKIKYYLSIAISDESICEESHIEANKLLVSL